MTCDNPRADINRDGVVDYKDLARLGAAFGSRPGDANWDPDADINQDGVIDNVLTMGARLSPHRHHIYRHPHRHHIYRHQIHVPVLHAVINALATIFTVRNV